MDMLTLSVVRVFAASVLCCYLSTAAPAITTETKAIMYLQKYGYMNGVTKSSPSSMMDEAAYSDAIKDFQKFTGLSETGILDDPTLEMMSRPRCGVPDKVGHTGSARRSKRYALEEWMWAKKDLAYRISKYSTSIKDNAKVEEEIARAFKVWSDVADLNFTVTSSEHIEIRFEKGKHCDGDEFDGAGKILAHAFPPEHGGDVHFNDEVEWTFRENSGTNLFQTALHELGHSLGLGHSNITAAVMFPIYQGYKPSFTLHKDDILGIQKMYGPPKKEVVTEPESELGENPDESGAPDLCQDPSIDVATATADGKTYFFKGNYYWAIEKNGISDGYPRKISDDWQGLPGNLDAAFTPTRDKTVFFKDNRYWLFHNKNKSMVSGFPRNLSSSFPVTSIDAAFGWNGSIYVFKGVLFWIIKVASPSSLYPKFSLHSPISIWEGLPNHIDAAFQWTNGYTYFFKGSNYYRVSKKTSSVDHADPPYPRPTSVWWLGCEKAPDICQDPSIDAAATTEYGKNNNKIYVFKGNYYWEIGQAGISDGYPRKISDDWPGLPGDLDAALTWTNGKTFFFKKNQFWRFHNKKMDNGYPQNISTGFPGIPNDIDSAFVWNLNEKIYFFKGDNFWRFDDKSEPSVSSRYPQPISHWQGLPNNIDAAVWWKNNVYFFKGNQYYKLNDKTPSVVNAEPPYPSYPRSTYFFILDCEDWKKLFILKAG